MVIVRAPVRISFGGGGTDLAAYYEQFGGLVVSTAITRYCYVIANRRKDGCINISSADYHVWETCERGTVPEIAAPLALPKAAIRWLTEQGLLESVGGVDLFLASDVPPGTGLGSSSAMAVALISALTALAGLQMTAAEAAELACHLEIERLHMPIGKQDQHASATGGLNTIEFMREGVQVTPLELPGDVISSLNARLLLFATGQTRDSADILGQQREDTQKKPKTIESLHRIKALAIEMREALLRGDLDGFGQLLDEGWREKKGLSHKVSSETIDQWYEVARQAGAIGGKITGAGGGGFLLLYCPQACQQAVRKALEVFGLKEMSFDLDFVGVQVLSQVDFQEAAGGSDVAGVAFMG
ncbi:MAG TPA: hypothetical protein VFB12_27465 [Ktedonobacteraceae bacterium]|nr:hypothetical protein [Ktedonobacteraceae bacterium]